MLFDAVVAAASGATVLHVRFCTRWYRFDVFDAAPGGTDLMCSMLLLAPISSLFNLCGLLGL